jgi:hypothetical protein
VQLASNSTLLWITSLPVPVPVPTTGTVTLSFSPTKLFCYCRNYGPNDKTREQTAHVSRSEAECCDKIITETLQHFTRDF